MRSPISKSIRGGSYSHIPDKACIHRIIAGSSWIIVHMCQSSSLVAELLKPNESDPSVMKCPGLLLVYTPALRIVLPECMLVSWLYSKDRCP